MLLAFDITRMQPGCPLVQAAMGGTPIAASWFPTSRWLLAPTDEMRLYEVDFARLAQLVKISQYAPVTLARDKST